MTETCAFIRSVTLHESPSKQHQLERIVEFSLHSELPDTDDLVAADAIEIHLESLGEYAQAESAIRSMYKIADRPPPPLLVRVNTCIASTTREALDLFNQLVGRDSEAHRRHVWYVGTTEGLGGLIWDLRALRLGDGVSCTAVQPMNPPP